MEIQTTTRQWYRSPYPVLSFTFTCPCISVMLHNYCIVPCCNCNCSIPIQICFRQWSNNCIKGQFPLMLFKNITKKRDVRERIFPTTQTTFVTELRADIVEDMKKLASSITVVRIHPQNHSHFAYRNNLQKNYAPV